MLGDVEHTPPPVLDGRSHRAITPALIAERILLSALRDQDSTAAAEKARAKAELRAAEASALLENERREHQAERLDSIGALAGGVAHDFNNLLTVISAHSAFLLDGLGAEHPYHEDAEAIQRAGERAAALTSQLLAFSRRQLLRPVALDLNQAIADSRTLLETLLGARVTLVVELAPDIAGVTVDLTQISAVMINLAVNARDAMRGGGTLVIKTRHTQLDVPTGVCKDVMPAGTYVTIIFRDDGPGMTEAIKAHLFEPFFTTKAFGSGTGLGLATTYGVIRQSGGYINVVTAPGEGSLFEVHLPATSIPSRARAGGINE